ncbi:MAG TPA: hypothetical protein VHL79_16390, partial [Ramlibacter sp.]|nr:hypothetical protein [Ramlibacter sp.]
RLCDQADDPGAIPTIRRRYTQAFGVPAPELAQVTEAKGLDGMPQLSARITAAWGRAEALELIEDGLFSVPPPHAALTLQAGRDLICLYDLALALLAENAAPQSNADAEAHPLAPWAANGDDPGLAQALAGDALPDADGGHQFALDVDLTASPEPLPDRQDPELLELELAPLLEEMKEQAKRNAKVRATTPEEDAFSAAMASERGPISRY